MVAPTRPRPGPGLSLAMSRPTSRVLCRWRSRPVPKNLACRSWKRVSRRGAPWRGADGLGPWPGSEPWAAGGRSARPARYSSRLSRSARAAGAQTLPSRFLSAGSGSAGVARPLLSLCRLWRERPVTFDQGRRVGCSEGAARRLGSEACARTSQLCLHLGSGLPCGWSCAGPLLQESLRQGPSTAGSLAQPLPWSPCLACDLGFFQAPNHK